MLGTALTRASARGHLPVVEYLCERAPQGGGGSLLMAADKEYQRAASAPELALPAADWPVKTPEARLHLPAPPPVPLAGVHACVGIDTNCDVMGRGVFVLE